MNISCTCVYREPIPRIYVYIILYIYIIYIWCVCLRRVAVIYETSNRFRSYTPGFRFEALTRYNVRIRGWWFDFPMLLFFIFRYSLLLSTIYNKIYTYIFVCTCVCGVCVCVCICVLVTQSADD
jgi:hypothetical protein